MSVRKRAKALFSAAFAVATLGAGASLTLPGVASAHTGDLHANAVCNTQTGQYDVTYTLTTHSVPSGVTGSTMWRIGTASFQGTPNSASGMDRGPVASSGNQTVTLGTESLPGNTVNGPWVYAFTTWSNGTTRGSDGRVEGLAGNCVPPPISDEEVWFDYEVPCGVSEVTQTGERRSYDWVWSNGEMTRQLVGIEPISRIVAVESEPCPVLGIVVTDLPCAGPDGATVQFTVTYNGVDNKFSVIALRDGVMPIGGPEVTLVNGVGMGSISLPAGEYTLRAYHEYASDIIPPADVNLMVDDCDDEPTGSMTGWEDCAVGTPTAFFQFIGFGEGDHSVSYTVDGGRSFVDVNWNGDSSPVQSHAAEAGEDSVYIYAESDGFPEGWAEYTVGIDDDCPPSLEASGSGTVCGVEGSGVITANKPFTYAVVYIVYGPDGDEELVVEYNGDEVTEFPFTFTAREERESYHIAFNTMSGDESSQGSFTVVQGDDCETPPVDPYLTIDVECVSDDVIYAYGLFGNLTDDDSVWVSIDGNAALPDASDGAWEATFNGVSPAEHTVTVEIRRKTGPNPSDFDVIKSVSAKVTCSEVPDTDPPATDPPVTTEPPASEYDITCADDGIKVTAQVGDIVVVFPAGSYPSMVIVEGESKVLPVMDGITLYFEDGSELLIHPGEFCEPTVPPTDPPVDTSEPEGSQPPSSSEPDPSTPTETIEPEVVVTTTIIDEPVDPDPSTPPANTVPGKLPETGASSFVLVLVGGMLALAGITILGLTKLRHRDV